MYTVYVLRSLKNSRRYVGHTNKLERRLVEHNSGQTKSIKYSGPYQVVYTEEYQTNLEASKRELELKTGKGREWLDVVVG